MSRTDRRLTPARITAAVHGPVVIAAWARAGRASRPTSPPPRARARSRRSARRPRSEDAAAAGAGSGAPVRRRTTTSPPGPASRASSMLLSSASVGAARSRSRPSSSASMSRYGALVGSVARSTRHFAAPPAGRWAQPASCSPRASERSSMNAVGRPPTAQRGRAVQSTRGRALRGRNRPCSENSCLSAAAA
jgi:hypothetical protein